MALPSKTDRVATWKLVGLGDFQFLKLEAHIVTRVRWRCSPAVIPITSVSSGKEMWHPAGGSLVCTNGETGHQHVFLHSPRAATAVPKSRLGALLG